MASSFMTSKSAENAEAAVRIEDNDRVLMELLFARAAWGIDAAPHVPTRLSSLEGLGGLETPLPFASPADEWTRDWEERLSALSEGRGSFPREDRDNPDSFNEWRAQQPPTWADKVGDAWPAEAYSRWLGSLFDNVERRKLEDDQEVQVQETLEDAYGRGLRSIIVLPIDEPFADSVSSTLLLLSSATRDIAADYREALTTRE